MDETDDFLKRMEVLRTALAMSQESLARELGVSFATVNRWKNRHNKPSRLARTRFQEFENRMRKNGKL